MGRIKQLIQIINGCEKKEFDKIVKSYLKNIYGFERIVVTDGKDDTGIDIKVFDIGGESIQYQMTIQKSETSQQKSQLKTKIFEDVEKASINAKEYGYSNNLYFFYSYVLTNKTQREYKREALMQYNINLEFIDANQIAEESEEYFALQQTIYNISGFEEFKIKTSQYESKSQNLIYDLISFGKTSDIKMELVETYIIQCLYEKGSLSQTEIAELCITKFSSKENTTFYTKLINKIYSKDKRLVYSKENKKYSLSEEEKNKLSSLIEQNKLEEQHFFNEVVAILKTYNQEDNLSKYIDLLYDLYINNFSKRIRLSDDMEKLELNNIFTYAKNQLKDPQSCKQMILNLLTICDNNKYMQEVCASAIFGSKINIDDLQNYAKEKKFVYIDTTIALHLLCYFYEQDNDYENYYYQLSKQLNDFCRKNSIELHLTNRYMWEITTHIQEAFNLVPFTKLSNFNSLGKSKNVFYNYYCYLFESNIIDYSYEEYLSNFEFRNSSNRTSDNYHNNQLIEQYLDNLGIKIIDIQKTYDINSTSKILGVQLASSNRNKTAFALNNDAIMLEYLGDNNDVHEIDPVFITWDKSLFKVLKEFFIKNPSALRWMQFTPSQFIDRYSLLSFSINEETITKEMLALLSGDIVNHTYSLLDSLALILNPEDKVGLEYAKRLVEMKDSQIYTTDKQSDEINENTDNNALDTTVFHISTHYRENEIQYNNIKKLFMSEEHMEEVLSIIDKSIKIIIEKHSFDKNIIDELDKIIAKL